MYPIVELYSGFIFLFSYSLFISGGLVNYLFVIFVLELLLILGLIDLRHLILPDSILATLLAGVLVLAVIKRWIGPVTHVDVPYWVGPGNGWIFTLGRSYAGLALSSFIGAASLFFFLFFIWLASKGKWLGFGDVKLAGIIGLIFGFWGGLIIFYGAIITGVIVGLVLLVKQKAKLKTKLPLGTFISFSATVYVFGGAFIQNRLANFFYFVPLIFE